MSLHKPSQQPKPTSRSARGASILVLWMFVFVCFVMGGAAQESSLAAVQTLIRKSKLDDADKQLQAILHEQPTNAKAMVLLGIVHRQQGNWADAEVLFRRATTARPQLLDAC